MAVVVDLEKCTGCGTCVEGCPVSEGATFKEVTGVRLLTLTKSSC